MLFLCHVMFHRREKSNRKKLKGQTNKSIKCADKDVSVLTHHFFSLILFSSVCMCVNVPLFIIIIWVMLACRCRLKNLLLNIIKSAWHGFYYSISFLLLLHVTYYFGFALLKWNEKNFSLSMVFLYNNNSLNYSIPKKRKILRMH